GRGRRTGELAIGAERQSRRQAACGERPGIRWQSAGRGKLAREELAGHRVLVGREAEDLKRHDGVDRRERKLRRTESAAPAQHQHPRKANRHDLFYHDWITVWRLSR